MSGKWSGVVAPCLECELACIALPCRTIVVQGSRPDRMVAMAMATLDANMCVSFRNHLLDYLILLQCL